MTDTRKGLFLLNRRSMKVHVLPFPVLALPDPRLLDRAANGQPVRSYSLIQANVGDHRHVIHDSNLGRTHGRLIITLRPFSVEIKRMKLQTFDKLALGFRLKSSQGRIAELLVDGPIRVGDGVKQSLVESQQFFGIGHGLVSSHP